MTSRLINVIARNLGCPEQGFFGWVTKQILRKKNKYLEQEAVRLCQIEPHHNVLEVGFGPGYGLEAAYEKVKGGTGKVCGVDISLYMVEVASKQVREGIQSGQVDISVGGVSLLPFSNDTFDRIFHVNCYYFWPNMHRALRELYRVIKPGGFMVATLNLESLKVAQERGLLKYGHPDPVKFMWALEQFGFRDVHIEYLNHDGHNFQAIFAKVNEKESIDLGEEDVEGEEGEMEGKMSGEGETKDKRQVDMDKPYQAKS